MLKIRILAALLTSALFATGGVAQAGHSEAPESYGEAQCHGVVAPHAVCSPDYRLDPANRSLTLAIDIDSGQRGTIPSSPMSARSGSTMYAALDETRPESGSYRVTTSVDTTREVSGDGLTWGSAYVRVIGWRDGRITRALSGYFDADASSFTFEKPATSDGEQVFIEINAEAWAGVFPPAVARTPGASGPCVGGYPPICPGVPSHTVLSPIAQGVAEIDLTATIVSVEQL